MANWQYADVFPAGSPDLTLIFKGLIALCQRSDNKHFEFGCFGADLGHRLRYRIDADGTAGQEIDIAPGRKLEFFVENAADDDIPRVYQSQFGDSRDFRYVMDMEEINGDQPLPKRKINFQNILTVKNGLLYTVAPTTSIFEIRNQEGTQQMAPRRVALLVGLQIFLDDNQKAILNIEGEDPIEFTKDGSSRFLTFNNECDSKYFPTSPNYKLRNDFYLDYQEIVDTAEAKENFLVMVAQKETNTFSSFTRSAALASFTSLGEDGGDDPIDDGGKNTSPCTLRGYGNTDGWGD